MDYVKQLSGNTADFDISELIANAIKTQQNRPRVITPKQQPKPQKVLEIEQTPEGEPLTWNVTPEQIARINMGDREALDEFYFESENFLRLKFSAHKYMRNNAYAHVTASYEDLIQQVYLDLRLGLLKFRPFDHAISCAIFHSFRYAPVGGIDEVYVFKTKEEKKCQKQVN